MSLDPKWVRTAGPSVDDDPQLDSVTPGSPEYLVQFQHPEKLLGMIPSPGRLDDMLSDPVLGVPADRAAAIRARFAGNVQRHARRVLAERPEIASRLERLGSARGPAAQSPIIAAGDSITDDLQSWAYMLQALLSSAPRPQPLPRVAPVLNFGRSGDTTTELLSRFGPVLAAADDLVIVQAGTNDAKRLAHFGGRPLVRPVETARNASTLESAVRHAGARLLWILPPTPDFSRLDACPWFVEEGMSWEKSGFAATRDAIRAAVSWSIDPDAVLNKTTDLLDDGLHPSAMGQAKICTLVVQTLASELEGARFQR